MIFGNQNENPTIFFKDKIIQNFKNIFALILIWTIIVI